MLHNIYSNHYFQVPHVSVPYNGDIPNGLIPGKQIYISGVVPHHADNFRFDLLTSSGAIAFVINPRFHANAIVRNTDSSGHGSWGPEERHGSFIFQKGAPFELIITAEYDKYRVTINGNHAFDYNHRMPLQEVNRLSVSGEIQLNRIVFSGGAGARGPESINPPVPYFTPIFNGAQPGRLIQIQGQIPAHCGRFEVDLQNGPGVQPPTIGLCFNVRFDDPHSGQAVVRVNRRGGAWGGEERQAPQFPFFKGSHFELLILIEHHEYKVAVNGQHFISFSHKSPLHEINHLAISGDVIVNAVRQF